MVSKKGKKLTLPQPPGANRQHFQRKSHAIPNKDEQTRIKTFSRTQCAPNKKDCKNTATNEIKKNIRKIHIELARLGKCNRQPYTYTTEFDVVRVKLKWYLFFSCEQFSES